jgi:FtsH-binding integral membrane protein
MTETIKQSRADFVLTALPIFLSAPALIIFLGASMLTYFVGNNSPLLISFIGLPAYIVNLAFAVTIWIKNRNTSHLRRASTLGFICSSAVVLIMTLMILQVVRKEYKSNQEQFEEYMRRSQSEENH